MPGVITSEGLPQSFGDDPLPSACPEPIAIVGMGCRFPGGASDPTKLWDLLINKRNGYREFPQDKLNIDGFYHPNRDRPGSIYTRGGYFLQEDSKQFDHGFFGITPLETMNLDPTQRKLLEVTYEAFENGGETLDSLSGSRTGVYVGNIQFDHSMMQMRDADFTLPYLTTGGSQTILSNRVNYVFNLKGPSLSLDTACSSSMYALHLATNAIRNNDCDAAIVAGTQLIQGPETQISCARLGAISPTSTCHTFDASADGYARAEGFGVLYIKRLSDAVANGDPIRAVIRGTAANTNGRTAGIAHPSPEGQEAVIKAAYKNAGGLDVNLTGYFECHGTGTPVGDPLEVSAIGRVFSSGRAKEDPLLIGSIKTNLGHAEAASGIAGVMKAVLAIESGVVPPTIGLVNPNPNIDFEGARVKVVIDSIPWPDMPIRRASVNSFGFGGANAHCILEHVSSVVPGYRPQGRRRSHKAAGSLSSNHLANGASHSGSHTTNGATIQSASLTNGGSLNERANSSTIGYTNGETNPAYQSATTNDVTNGFNEADCVNGNNGTPRLVQRSLPTRRKILLPFSARDESALSANVAAIASIANEYEPADLSYTLSARRSKFSQRAYAVVDANNLTTHGMDLAFGSADSQQQEVGFVFTGQGAQWPGMGLDVYHEYEAFRRSIHHQNEILAKLKDGPSWKIEEILMEPAETSRIHEPQYSQTLCTAIQIALVDLIYTWNVKPIVSVGHSAGEIAAAYASGHITAAEAIAVAYYRGKAVEMNTKDGRMLAVGLGPHEATDYLGDFEGRAQIACYNSPQSVTISGDTEAVLEIQGRLNDRKVFNRILKTGNNAYHSHHMGVLGKAYEELATNGFKDILEEIDAERSRVSRAPTLWVSSVHPSKPMSRGICDLKYWRRNMESPVQFMQAVEVIAEGPEAAKAVLCELGPHPALGGPLKQIRKKVEGKLGPAFASLQRGKSGLDSMLNLGGNLFLNNASVDLTRMNAVDIFDKGCWKLAHGSFCIDLPPYSYHYGPNIFYENRLNREWRLRKHLRHDILGARVPGCSKFRPVWRNILRVKDLPWLSEQKLHSNTIFTPAGYIAMAVEAVTQVNDEDRGAAAITGYTLRDVEFAEILRIPDNDFGIETVFDLRPSKTSQSRRLFEFNVSSVPADGEDWLDHCSGSIEIETSNRPPTTSIAMKKSARSIDIDRWYEQFSDTGHSFGSSFQLLSSLRARDGDHKAAATVSLTPTSSCEESKYLVHPATIDSVVQLAIISAHSGQTEKLRSAFIAARIKELSIHVPHGDELMQSIASAVAQGEEATSRQLVAQAQLSSHSGASLLEIKGLLCTPFDSPSPRDRGYDPCLKLIWEPDVTAMSDEAVRSKFPAITKASEIGHKFDKLEELAIYTIVDIYEAQKHAMEHKRDDELQFFLEWVQRNIEYASKGELIYGAEALAASSEERNKVIDRTMKELENVHEAKLINAIHRNLDKILAGETSGLNVALEGNLLTELYVSGVSITAAYPQMLNIVNLIAHQNPRMNIIEVGGGTGGATRHILMALGGDKTFKKYQSYTFTDVSSGFLSAVETEFAVHKNMVYKTLDLEGEPADQGFEPKYDLVIASQVLHTTGSIQKAVSNARKLLRPGGKLVLLELTRIWLGAGIVLGTFPGYWNGLKDGRLDSPFVDKTRWQELLTTAGFSGIDISLDDHEDPFTLTSTMIATAIEQESSMVAQLTDSYSVHIVYRHYIHPLGREVQKLVERAGGRVKYIRLTEASKIPPQSRVITLVDIEDNTLMQCSEIELDALKELAGGAESILWVYAGNSIEGSRPESGITIGLLRALITELPHVRFASLGLPKEFASSLSSVAQTLLSREKILQELKPGAVCDHEYILHEGLVHISRLEPDDPLNTRYQQLEGLQPSVSERAPDSVVTAPSHFDDHTDVSQLLSQTDRSLSEPLESHHVEVKAAPAPVHLDDKAVYLLVGCLGGFGRSISSSMVDHGARRLVFVSRSGATRPDATELIEELQARGVTTDVIECSVTDKPSLVAAVEKITKEATIKGVVHAAMVEGDGAFENVTHEQLQRVLGPKVQGTVNLHEATLNLPLDFFLMTSSVVAMVGTATQGLYSAANAFQDSFARHRRSLGLVGQSVAFGPILEVGFLSDLPGVRGALMRNGLYSQTEYEVLRLFESALANEFTGTRSEEDPLSGAHIITGLEPRQLHRLHQKGLAIDSPWHADARFARLLTAVEDLSHTKKAKAEEKNVLDLLRDAAPDEKKGIITQAVCDRFAKLLYLAPGSIDPKHSLSSCGMDSMIAAELRNWLFKTFQVDVAFLDLLSPQTKVMSLVDMVLAGDS